MLCIGIADIRLAEVGAQRAQWDREHAAGIVHSLRETDPVVREAELLHHAAFPVMWLMINLKLGHGPGADASQDASLTARAALSRLQIAALRDAGIDGEMADLNVAVLDWIDARILDDIRDRRELRWSAKSDRIASLLV